MLTKVVHGAPRGQGPSPRGGEVARPAVSRVTHLTSLKNRILACKTKCPEYVEQKAGILFVDYKFIFPITSKNSLVLLAIEASLFIQSFKLDFIYHSHSNKFRPEISPAHRQNHATRRENC